MLTAIFSSIGGALFDKVFGGILDIAKGVLNKQITEIEAKAKIKDVFIKGLTEIEVSHSESLAKTYASFWDAASKDETKIMKRMWAWALGSQLFVLFWSQFIVPLMYTYGAMPNGWKAGTSAEWAYLIVVALLGMGPAILRSGPASGGGGLIGMAKTFLGMK